ncbi:hypothetical protein LCGC14_0657100 [marine sediment metagenome]|uniref:CN hydrolase domain-containing protein n=1 Tax=marine sediment metagenome TaxID=412755 RepID=A0A0F9QZS1_9ZZZZ
MSVFVNDKEYEVIDSTLYLDEIYFKKFSDIKGIENLKDLKKLSLGGNYLENLDGIEVLEKLEFLYLKLNYLGEINHINELRNLKVLNLEDNGIKIIRGLDNLTNLEILSLSYNEIEKIENLENLKNIRELYLDCNSIKEIEGLDNLSNLKALYLNVNEISEIKGLEDLTNLDVLNLEVNGIKIIRGLDNLTNLEILSLSYNEIEKIENLENLNNLKKLYLDYNNINEIEGLDNLSNLKALYLNVNEISEIKGLEGLTNLDELNLEDNSFKEKEEQYLVNSEAPLKAIIYYCRTKKLETDEIKLLNCYEKNKNFSENIDILKKTLQAEEISEFINIGTHLEKKEIAIMQNLIFYDQIPEEVYLQDKADKLDKLRISLIQINSLKNVNPEGDDKIGHFLFFIKQFWDENEVNNNVLVYNQDERLIDSKIKECLKLSLLTKPNLIIFPENSVPYGMKDYLIQVSQEKNLIIVCGLEHQKVGTNYVNRAIIIDNGECREQIKQTPVEIKRHNGNHIREKIECVTFPKIKIFLTSIGRVAIFICKDFLRLSEKITGWARKNKIDYLILPSLTSKILPFHTRLINLLNYTRYDRLKIIFSSIAEYGGSEFFSIDQIGRIEKSYRKKNQDNIGEVIVTRKFVYYGDKITYNKEEGIVRIKCRKCNKKYMTQTNGAHILPRTAPEHEKKNWEFYLHCTECGFKNYRY